SAKRCESLLNCLLCLLYDGPFNFPYLGASPVISIIGTLPKNISPDDFFRVPGSIFVKYASAWNFIFISGFESGF
ncbi:hypothetical protein, partial [Vibrio parahaemolyticus]